MDTQVADKQEATSWKVWKHRRYILMFLAAFGLFNEYYLKVNLSIAILAMTQDRYLMLENGTQVNIGPEFDWDNEIQGYILSAFFYGSMLTQFFGTFLARRFTPKLVIGLGVAVAALLTLLNVWLAEVNVFAFLIVRVVIGMFEGPMHPSLYYMYSKWIPPTERTRATCLGTVGLHLGTVTSMIFSAYLAKVAGWRSIFWFSGSLALLWFVIWWTVLADSPEQDRRITKAELHYITLTLKDSKTTKTNAMPWKGLFTSKVIWALNGTMFCEAWVFFTLLTLLPKYFVDVFKFDISQSGALAALPYICQIVMLLVTSQVVDRIITWKWLSVTATRKTFTVLGFLLQMSFMLGAIFWEHVAGNIFCLVMAVALSALTVSTISANALDVAPQYANLVYGLGSTFSSLSGVISPTVAGYIVSTENPTVQQWQLVFYIAAGIFLLGSIIYLSFGSGERQSWDFEENDGPKVQK